MRFIRDVYHAYQYDLPFSAEVIARAPGRINLIGEHTDYNGGFVMPAAIAQSVSIAIRKLEPGAKCRIYSLDKEEEYSFELDTMAPSSIDWPNYFLGVVSELQKLGAQITPFEAAIGGNVPLGSGMSSSAALESATGLALNELFQLGFTKTQLIKAAQMAEHHFVGTRCGIMDMFASVMGRPNSVIQLDCRSLDYQYFPLDLGDYELLFLNTNVTHSLADSAYNERRAACEEGVVAIQQLYPNVQLLRDVDLSMLEQIRGKVSDTVLQRCRYVVEENQRVEQASKAMLAGDFEGLGKLIYASHDGLQNDYEVSCKELDFLVDSTRKQPNILGARMMGGGFGGCTLNIIKKGFADQFIADVAPSYEQHFGKAFTPIRTRIGDGAKVIFKEEGLNFSDDPHRRYNILTGEWVLVSPHRTRRPWQGKQETPAAKDALRYDPECYLCPGNKRIGGVENPDYPEVYVFDNDFGALLPGTADAAFQDRLLQAKAEKGICRVICFSSDHSLTLPEMEVSAIEKVVQTWGEQYTELGAKPGINHVQIFENKGAVMGCSNPHPHGQIWAQASVPGEAQKKLDQQKKYWEETGNSLLGDYLNQELEQPEQRLICQNDDFVALVPFWAVWPYELMIVPIRHFQSIAQMTTAEQKSFAEILKRATTRMDNLFETSFPYSAGLMQAPTDGKTHDYVHFHMSFYPPLLRSATVKKFMVGYEMFANPQRDISAEQAADALRQQSEIHFRQ